MFDILILLFFWALIFSLIGGVFYVLFAKFLKGAINIHLAKRSYKFGEIINWSFILHAKKDIEITSLTVSLAWYERESMYVSNGQKQTRRNEVTRITQEISLENNTLNAGIKQEFDIELIVPSYEQFLADNKNIDFRDNTRWKLAQHDLGNKKRSNLSWQLQVDVESQGLDLYGKKEIFVSK